jgi:hypothetical protein
MAHALGNPVVAETLENGARAHALGEQTGLAIAGQPAAEVIHARRSGRPAGRRNYRTEQLVSYLSAKGKMPAEMLHDVLRQGWRKLQKDLGISAKEAFEIWRDLNLALMPYTAPKLAALEIAATGDGAGALGAGALHLLAAQQIAGILAAAGQPAPSPEFGAASQVIDNAALFGTLPDALPDDRPLE